MNAKIAFVIFLIAIVLLDVSEGWGRRRRRRRYYSSRRRYHHHHQHHCRRRYYDAPAEAENEMFEIDQKLPEANELPEHDELTEPNELPEHDEEIHEVDNLKNQG